MAVLLIIFSFGFKITAKEKLKQSYDDLIKYKNIIVRKNFYFEQKHALQDVLEERLSHVMRVKDDEEAAKKSIERLDEVLKQMPGITLLSQGTMPAMAMDHDFYRIEIKLKLRASLIDFNEFIYFMEVNEKALNVMDIEIINQKHAMEYNVKICMVYKKRELE